MFSYAGIIGVTTFDGVIGNRPRGTPLRLRCCPASLPFEQVMDDSERDLALAHDDAIGAHRLQVLDLGVRMGACDDVDGWIGGTRLLHDLPCLEGFRYRDQQMPGAGQIGQLQNFGTRSVSGHGLEPSLPKLLEDAVRILDDEERLTARLQGIGNDAADAPIADKDRVTSQARGGGGPRG